MTEPQHEPPDDDAPKPWSKQPPASTEEGKPLESVWRRQLILICLLLPAVVAGAYAVYDITGRVMESKQTNLRSRVTPNGDSDSTTTAEVVVEEALIPPMTVVPTDNAVRRSEVLKAHADIEAAQSLLERLKKQQNQWQEFVEPLLSDEVGQRIAADPGAVKLFAAAASHERITPKATEGLRQSLLALAVPVETAMTDEEAALDLDSGFSEQLQSISTQLRTGLKHWQDDNVLVRLLVREAKDREPVEATLAVVIEILQAEEIRQRAEKIAAEVAANKELLRKDEVASKMRLQELENRKQLAADQVVAKREEAKIAGLKAEELALANQIAAARKKAELERKYEADLPEIRRVLVPFITPGHKQIANGKWTYREELQPLSLSGIIAARTLGEDDLSCQRLCFIGGGRENDRPNGSFRSYIGGAMRPGDMPNVRKVQRPLTHLWRSHGRKRAVETLI